MFLFLSFSSDLSFAIQYCRVLKLTVIPGGQTEKVKTLKFVIKNFFLVFTSPFLCQTVVPGQVVAELRGLSDRMTHLLDSWQDQGSVGAQVGVIYSPDMSPSVIRN